MDAADILGAPRGSNTFQPRSRPQSEAAAKGLKGLNREIFALTGGVSTGEVAPASPTQPSFKTKRKGPSKQVQWEWKAFPNQARSDGLELRHWQKKGMQWDEYPFAKFNKALKLLKYTDEDYAALLKHEEWSRVDTDTLMALVQRFGMNFIMVHDRWKGERERSLEHLKDRFYTIQRKLTQAKGPEKEAPAGGVGSAVKVDAPEENVLLTKPYNLEYEIQRKAYLEKMYSASKRDEVAEQEIVEKARKIEAMMKKRKQDAKKRKQTDAADQPITPSEGKAVLRSQMFADPRAEEQVAIEKVLKGVGMEVKYSISETQETYGGLKQDIITLLEWYKRVIKRKKELGKEEEYVQQKVAAHPAGSAPKAAEPSLESSSSSDLNRRDKERKIPPAEAAQVPEAPASSRRDRERKQEIPQGQGGVGEGPSGGRRERDRAAQAQAPTAAEPAVGSKRTREQQQPTAAGAPANPEPVVVTRREKERRIDAPNAPAPESSMQMRRDKDKSGEGVQEEHKDSAEPAAEAESGSAATRRDKDKALETAAPAGEAEVSSILTRKERESTEQSSVMTRKDKEKKQDAAQAAAAAADSTPVLTRRQREEKQESAAAETASSEPVGSKRKSTRSTEEELPLEKRLRKR